MSTTDQKPNPSSPTPKTIQIPPETLTTLLSSISSLRTEVSTLQNQLSSLSQSHHSLSTQLLTLQKSQTNNTAKTFIYFPKLPPEIQTKIWHYALTSIPQLHILGIGTPSGSRANKTFYTSHSTSSLNAIILSCKTAWKIAEDLKLDYLIFKTYIEKSHIPGGYKRIEGRSMDPDKIEYKNFVNLGIDTFWIMGDSVVSVPAGVEAFCGTCTEIEERTVFLRGGGNGVMMRKHFKRRIHNPSCSHGRIGWEFRAFPIHTLVMNLDSWQEPFDRPSQFRDGTIYILQKCSVRHLLLVISSPANPTPNTIFVTPDCASSQNHPKTFLGEGLPDTYTPWYYLEGNLVEAMRRYKEKRARDRAAYCEEEQISAETLDDWIADGVPTPVYLGNLESWEIPTVRFVHAVPRGGKWVYTPESCRYIA